MKNIFIYSTLVIFSFEISKAFNLSIGGVKIIETNKHAKEINTKIIENLDSFQGKEALNIMKENIESVNFDFIEEDDVNAQNNNKKYLSSYLLKYLLHSESQKLKKEILNFILDNASDKLNLFKVYGFKFKKQDYETSWISILLNNSFYHNEFMKLIEKINENKIIDSKVIVDSFFVANIKKTMIFIVIENLIKNNYSSEEIAEQFEKIKLLIKKGASLKIYSNYRNPFNKRYLKITPLQFIALEGDSFKEKKKLLSILKKSPTYDLNFKGKHKKSTSTILKEKSSNDIELY